MANVGSFGANLGANSSLQTSSSSIGKTTTDQRRHMEILDAAGWLQLDQIAAVFEAGFGGIEC